MDSTQKSSKCSAAKPLAAATRRFRLRPPPKRCSLHRPDGRSTMPLDSPSMALMPLSDLATVMPTDEHMTDVDDLRDASVQLKAIHEKLARPDIQSPLRALKEAANQVGKSWSGSWFGYQSRVYYTNFEPPPPGAHFSSEWGLQGRFQGTTGAWLEYEFDDVIALIYRIADSPALDTVRPEINESQGEIEAKRGEILSIVGALEPPMRDAFIERLIEETQKQNIFTARDFLAAQRPSGKFFSRDTTAISQGLAVPPHISVLAQVFHVESVKSAAKNLADRVDRIASHLDRLARNRRSSHRAGASVFIGHGRSPTWRELKDFLQDRLRLPWDEFNRVPVAGVTNITRLSEMLDAASIAFIILTAEDEQADGSMRARMNVIHEAGLFQGRLGFTKAIILLEEGCEAFSNIDGLGQIRFDAGNITSVFEEVRRVLEREGLLENA